MKILKIILFFFIIISTGCDNDDYDFTYETIVTELPVNLENLNSPFDDYNSNLPYHYPVSKPGIYFSTNRNSSGSNFDIIYRSIEISYHSKDDILNISDVIGDDDSNRYASKLLETINTEFNEYGPFYYFGEETYEYFFYANNESGNFDIKYASSKKSDFGTYNAQEIINTPESFDAINSEYDDYYPCIFNNNESLIFCSNREMDMFNIYETTFVEEEINPSYHAVTRHNVIKNAVLSSDKNDKCPFVSGNIMVFTSDREGGYGGFDLYYSQYLNGEWSQPQNLGDKINSEYDEYRPIFVPFEEFDGSMLIFSSNRSGGKGGFDLYAVRSNLL